MFDNLVSRGFLSRNLTRTKRRVKRRDKKVLGTRLFHQSAQSFVFFVWKKLAQSQQIFIRTHSFNWRIWARFVLLTMESWGEKKSWSLGCELHCNLQLLKEWYSFTSAVRWLLGLKITTFFTKTVVLNFVPGLLILVTTRSILFLRLCEEVLKARWKCSRAYRNSDDKLEKIFHSIKRSYTNKNSAGVLNQPERKKVTQELYGQKEDLNHGCKYTKHWRKF